MIDWFTEFADALVPLFGIVAFFGTPIAITMLYFRYLNLHEQRLADTLQIQEFHGLAAPYEELAPAQQVQTSKESMLKTHKFQLGQLEMKQRQPAPRPLWLSCPALLHVWGRPI